MASRARFSCSRRSVTCHARVPAAAFRPVPNTAPLRRHTPRVSGFPETQRYIARSAIGRRGDGVVRFGGLDSLRNHPSYDADAPKPDASDKKTAKSIDPAKVRAGAVVRVQATRSGRGGKTVTVVSGLPAEELPVLAKSLKAKCGSGGKVRGEDLELQGDHTAKLVELLKGLGFKNTKKSGG